MNEKVNLQDLVSLLAQKTNISKKEAEMFLKEYFAVITDGLLDDGSVKIKNLGSFKLIQVSERESIDVNQGTRVLIPSHYKVGYTPETQFAQDINGPFSWLESVDLDQETTLKNDDNQEKTVSEPLPVINTEPKQPEIQKPIVPEIKQEKAVVSETIIEKKEIIEEKSDDNQEETVSEPLPVINTEPKQPEIQKPIVPEIKQEKAVVSETIIEKKEVIEKKSDNDDDDDSYESLLKTIFWEKYEKYEKKEKTGQTFNRRKKNKKLFVKWISIIFVIIIILIGAYLYWEKDKYFPKKEIFTTPIDDDFWNEYYTKKKDNDSISLPDTIVTQENKPLLEEDENVTGIIVPKDTAKRTPINPPVLNNENNNLLREVGGTDDNQRNRSEEINSSQEKEKGKTRIVSSGDRLTSIALEEFGHKAFWVYIYEENKNQIKDPDNLQIGIEITIPPMSKYKINKNDMESLQNANRLSDKYHN